VNVRSRITVLPLFTLAIAALSIPVLQAQATQEPAPAQATQEPTQAAASRQDTTRELSIAVGKTALIDFNSPVIRASIGLGDIATVSAVSPTEILVNGKTPGSTTLIVWEQGGVRHFFNVTVHESRFAAEDSMASLHRQLSLELPGQDIHATTENGQVYLRGTVKDLTSSDRAVQIASNAGAGKVVNLLYVDVPQSPPQILLKVRFCSVDRSLEKQLGINIFNLGAGNFNGGVTTGQYSPPTIVPSPAPATVTETSGLNLSVFDPNINVGATLEALETKGVVESLAEPNIIAIDGQEASFLAGGKYPYPVVQGTASGAAGAVTIQFQEYGIRLNFIPTVTPRGTIRLQLAPEVSSLDFASGLEISGFDIPSIDERRVKTEVELGNGQSFVIGGLLDNTESETFEKIPFLGDIPILGKLFQSIQRTKNNTELIVVVTPTIVAPIPSGAPLPNLHWPTKFLPPNSNISMSNPEGPSAAGSPQPTAMPVEQLIESNKPEKPLTAAGSYSTQ
jgi:pilus assembly protein CpaC